MTTISTSPPSSASASSHSSDEVALRLRAVLARIERAGGDPAAVRVVAVTKGFGPDAVLAAREAGLRDLGENYATELVAKAHAAGGREIGGPGGRVGAVPAVAPPIWHFLGAIQRNKVAQLAPLVGLWQSVARAVEGARIARFAPGAAVLVEVDTTGQSGRNGCRPDETGSLVEALRTRGLDVQGLMTVAAPGEGAARLAFGTVRRLADELGLAERSMGMSDDLETAVAAGSTMVRVGRALFGDRPPRA